MLLVFVVIQMVMLHTITDGATSFDDEEEEEEDEKEDWS